MHVPHSSWLHGIPFMNIADRKTLTREKEKNFFLVKWIEENEIESSGENRSGKGLVW